MRKVIPSEKPSKQVRFDFLPPPNASKMSSGRDLLLKADRKANAPSSFFSFTSSSAKAEEAHDLYISAANAFTLEKSWKDAGDCFVKAGEASLRGEERDEAAGDFWKAAKAYKKTNPERTASPRLRSITADLSYHTVAVGALQRTIELLKTKGSFRQAADRQKEVAVIYQQEGGDLMGALEAYEQAGELYMAEDATAFVFIPLLCAPLRIPYASSSSSPSPSLVSPPHNEN